jgi:NAD(P)-dependent dehydrogenase (short-subunit alcohol dehydrogenase family)
VLNQHTAVITGAGSGFGRLTAEAFVSKGWRVYAGVRNADGRNATAAKTLRASGATVIDLDVTDDASVQTAAKLVLDDVNAVDVLVNNAGSGYFGIAEAFTPEAFERQFDVNFFGALRVNRAFLPSMRDRRSGLVVFVSSILGRFVVPFGGPYIASKWALEAVAEISSYELAPFGVDVAIVEPGAYPTEISGKFTGADDSARVASYGDFTRYSDVLTAAFAQEKEGRDAGDVARAVVHLAEMPAGERPLRTPVPENPALDVSNAAAASLQYEMLQRYGLQKLLPTVVAGRDSKSNRG